MNDADSADPASSTGRDGRPPDPPPPDPAATAAHSTRGSTPDPQIGIRASDADRAQTAAFIQAALETGALTFTEGDQRLAATYAARYCHDLQALTADLPLHHLVPATGAGQPTCAACGARLTGPIPLLLTAARLAASRTRHAVSRARPAVVVPVALIVLLIAAAFGWAALHELGIFADHETLGP